MPSVVLQRSVRSSAYNQLHSSESHRHNSESQTDPLGLLPTATGILSNLYHIVLRSVYFAHLTLTSNLHSHSVHQFVFICLLPKYKCRGSRWAHCYPNHCPLLANLYRSLDG